MADENKGTPGGQPQEKVEDRPFVGQVEPGDYPADERAGQNPNGAVDDRQRLEENQDDRTGGGELAGDRPSSGGASKDPANTNSA